MKHGMTGTRAYRIWQNMKNRCYNKNVKQYKDYGGRGISVCKRWINSFKNFYQDMGEPPKFHSINRINNNGNYCPSNCTWSSNYEQANNARSNIKLEFNGLKLSLSQWARKQGINYDTLRYRLLYYKWDLEKSLTRHPEQLTHACLKCGYMWTSKKENPVGCAKCKTRKNIKKIS